MNTLSLPRSAIDLLPHRAPMLLLDEVADYRDGAVRGNATITEENAFVGADGRLEPVALIEILAQTAAALRGCEAELDGDSEDRIGFLVGLRQLKISAPARVGDSLTVDVHRTAGLGQAIVMEGRISNGDDCLACGTMNVWEENASVALAGAPPMKTTQSQSDKPFDVAPQQELASMMHRAVCACASPLELNADSSEAVSEFCFDESFDAFGGHFPGFPILPGIVMLKMALLLCEGITDCGVELVGVDRAKFAGRVRPDQPIRTQVQVSPVGRLWKVAARIVDSKTDALVLKLNSTVKRAKDDSRTAGRQ